MRLAGKLERAKNEIALLREIIRIKNARMSRIQALRRPHYTPEERMAILELRATQGWSAAQPARTFLIQSETTSSWTKRINEQGKNALVQILEPVNRFPEFVAYVVKRLKILCPILGKKKTAQILARAGLHLGATTIARMLKSKPAGKPAKQSFPKSNTHRKKAHRVVTATYPHHVWHVDLTTIPTSAGFWVPWLPWSLP